jgi:hypothetical protein
LNNVVGWIAFGISLVVYLLTVSPTASFWDCGEFIAVSNELEVPHPPGAPMYLLLGRLFAMFAPGPESVAYMVNLLSVFSSAFTALFTFWIVTAFGKKILSPKGEPSRGQSFALMAAGMAGALACTFADSIWFNAVEAEVYAPSSFFTAIVIWLMMKWEVRADEPDHLKWLILIAYMMGLSIGVHLLNLLAIPALGAIYYFRKYKFSWLGFGVAMAVSVFALGVINSFVIKNTFDVAFAFEKLFTGSVEYNPDTGKIGKETGLGLPFGTGALLFAVLFVSAVVFGIWYGQKKNLVALNVSLLSLVMVYLGLSSYTMLIIRSNAAPPINENNPSNLLNFVSYMKREQYGDWPLLKGPMYNAQPTRSRSGDRGTPMYYKFITEQKDPRLNNKYVHYDYKPEYEWVVPVYRNGELVDTKSGERVFPRMHSSSHYDGRGAYSYKNFVKDKGPTDSPYDDNPTSAENLKFFWQYQVSYMYLRYFMWNFVGREGDEQGRIDDWESGLNFVKTRKLPEHLRNDPYRNHYYFLPLILGLAGLFWQYKRSKRDAVVVGMLFFFTGLAIILYLNQTPSQPRERDYSYAGSFQTFCIWIGLGVLALFDFLQKRFKLKEDTAAYLSSAALLIPVQMGVENWADHSRAGNYVAPDSARNMLESCAQDGILFTNGDNDTFPLWYLQEVEGVRTDVRIINLSLINTDWYCHQLKQSYNGAKPVPLTLPETEYMGEVNGVKYLTARDRGYDPATGTLTVTLPVDKRALIDGGLIPAKDSSRIESPMVWRIKARGGKDNKYLQKQDVMIINILENIAKEGWKRPFYFAITIPSSSFLSLEEYFQLEGMATRVLPIRTPGRQERVNKEAMYENLTKKYRFRGLDDDKVFYDSNIRRMTGNMRHNFIRLASAYIDDMRELQAADSANPLIAEYGKRAVELIDMADKKISDAAIRTESYYFAQYARVLAEAGEKEKAKVFLKKAHARALEDLTTDRDYLKIEIGNRNLDVYTLQIVFMLSIDELNDPETAKIVARDFEKFTGSAQLNQELKRRNMDK